MRAVVLNAFGGTDVLEVRQVEEPSPGPGELLVRVVASATNPVEAKIRAAGRWSEIRPPAVIGYDASGVVQRVGVGVRDFEPGDDVFFTPEIIGNQWGTHAEYTVVSASITAHKPKGISHEQAAAVPLAGGTAFEAVVRRLRVEPGETLLVHGGAGGVGSFAVQLGRACGARVIATARTDHQSALRDLGVDVPVDYTREDVAEIALRETGGVGVDAAFTTVGGETVSQSIRATRPFGRIAYILPPGGDLSESYAKNLTLHGIFLTRERRRLEQLGRIIERGRLVPRIAESMPLEQVALAHERLDSGHGVGKLVLQVSV